MARDGTVGTDGGAATIRMFGEAIAFFTGRVHAIRDDQWDAPTPCADWTVRDLVNHVTVEQLWVPPLVLEGSPIEDQRGRWEGDQLGDDPVGAWDRASTAAFDAFRAPGTMERVVHLSTGNSNAEAYCSQMTMDATVHGWDLSRALGMDDRLPPHLVTFALEEIGPYAHELEASGLFAPAVPVAEDADDQTKLLARLGRKA